MDFKFDIRIIALSILIHVGAFALLSFYTQKHTTDHSDAIEVVIRDDSDTKRFLPSQHKEKEEPQEATKTSKFFSEQNQKVEKETIAQNLGNFKNQKTQKTQVAQKETAPTPETTPGPNFMPVEKQTSSQEERESSINFQVPNLAKGEFTYLNSDFSTYASFYNRITPKIVYTWGNNIDDIAMFPHMREKLRQKLKWITRVELILNKKGDVKDVVIMHSSGSVELDQAVQEALQNAGPYLNPPSGMIEKDGNVHILGEFSVHTQRPRLAY